MNVTVKPMRGNVGIPELVALGRTMFNESRFARLGFDEEKAANYAEHVLLDDTYISIGAFDGAQCVGMAIGVCGNILPFSSSPVATQHLLYLAPHYRGEKVAPELIFAFITESKVRGALDVVFSNGTGYQPEIVCRLFELCGLKKVGGIYSLGV